MGKRGHFLELCDAGEGSGIAGSAGKAERGGGVIAARACKRENLRQFMWRLWYCHNAIIIYHVVIPWRREVTYQEMGIGRPYPR